MSQLALKVVIAVAVLQVTIQAGDRLRWEDQHDFLNGGFDVARSVTIDGKIAVVAGVAGFGLLSNLVVRAYNVANGSLRWAAQAPAAGAISAWVGVTSAGETVYTVSMRLRHVRSCLRRADGPGAVGRRS